MPILLAMSLWRGRHSAYAAYLRRVRALDALLYERIDGDDADGTLLGVLKRTGASREPPRRPRSIPQDERHRDEGNGGENDEQKDGEASDQGHVTRLH